MSSFEYIGSRLGSTKILTKTVRFPIENKEDKRRLMTTIWVFYQDETQIYKKGIILIA